MPRRSARRKDRSSCGGWRVTGMHCSRATRTTLTVDREGPAAALGDQEAEAAGPGTDSPTG